MASSTRESQTIACATSRSWADIAAGRKESSKLEEQLATDTSSEISQGQSIAAEMFTAGKSAPAAIHGDNEILSQPLDIENGDKDVAAHKREPLRKYLDPLSEGASSTTLAQATAFLRPGTRGSWKCFCLGEVVMMCGSYGWLAVHGDVDHPDADLHEGHIYVHKRDIAEGEQLEEGDLVSFYLYADKRGLGAEYCCRHVCVPSDTEIKPEQSISAWTASGRVYSADAIEFVPSWTGVQPSGFRASAPEFVPSTGVVFSDDVHEHDGNFYTEAAVFAPSGFSKDAPEFVPCKVGSATSTCESESGCEADDETADCVACDTSSACSESTSEHTFVDHDDDVAAWDKAMEAVIMTAPLRRCALPVSHEDTSSTCDGEVSGSDVSSDMMIKTPTGWIRPPPGLSIFG